jgi:adenylate cyclase
MQQTSKLLSFAGARQLRERGRPMTNMECPQKIIRFGEFEVDLQGGCLFKQGAEVRLRRQLFTALTALLDHAGEVVTREELQERLWPGDVLVDFETNLNTIIARLRQALGDSAESPRYIETLPKRGYRFLMPAVTKKTAEKRRKNSIAVMPFADLSPEKDQEYFCDGLAEELINSLIHIQALRVAARSSSFSFKGKNLDIRKIGEKLNVQVILTGSMRKVGESLRITAQLVSVADGYNLWSEKYDRKTEDIFAVQDEISLEIVDALKLKLVKGEKTKVLKRHTRNKDAYNLFLKGRYFWNRRNEEDLKKAIKCYDEAIKTDPNYSLPYLGIADHFIMMGLWNYLPPQTARLRAKEALNNALEIDDQLGEAYTSLGYFQFLFDWDWHAAEKNLKRGIALNPHNSWAHAWYGCYLLGMSRFEEACAELRMALEMEPLSPIINAIAGIIISIADADEGKKQMDKAIEMEPNLALAHFWMGWILMSPEVIDEKALAHLQMAVDLGYTSALGWLGCCYGRLGKKEEAFKILSQMEKLSKERYISPLQKSTVYSGLGIYDQAFEFLEKACLQKEPLLALILYNVEGHSAYSQEFRLDERFKELMRIAKKIG